MKNTKNFYTAIDEDNREQDWSKDKFGNHQSANNARFSEIRTSDKFKPIDREGLHGYYQRLLKLAAEQENTNLGAHVYGRKMWFTHKNPSECWICQDLNIMWQIITSLSVVNDYLQEHDIHLYFTSNPKTGQLYLKDI